MISGIKPLSLFFLALFIISGFCIGKTYSQATPESASFGNPVTPQLLNWSRFWGLFNQYSAWDLEYNEGAGWISIKSDLQVIKNYSRIMAFYNGSTYREYNLNNSEADACKIGLNFTASYTADYRLTFAIDLDVKNYTYREGSWNYTLSYQNYTVFFDWSDLQGVPLDSVTHGVLPVGEDRYFWFRIRKNNVAEGTNLYIDPSFGHDDIEASLQNWSGSGYAYRNMVRFTPLSGDGTLDSITVYVDFSTEQSQNMSCAFYFGGNNTEIANSEIRYISGDGWYQFNFTGDPVVANNTQYGLAFWGEDGAPTVGYRYLTTTGESIRYASDQTGWPNWPTTFSGTDTTTRLVSIYANYTLSAVGRDETFSFSESGAGVATLDFSKERAFRFSELGYGYSSMFQYWATLFEFAESGAGVAVLEWGKERGFYLSELGAGVAQLFFSKEKLFSFAELGVGVAVLDYSFERAFRDVTFVLSAVGQGIAQLDILKEKAFRFTEIGGAEALLSFSVERFFEITEWAFSEAGAGFAVLATTISRVPTEYTGVGLAIIAISLACVALAIALLALR